MSIKKISALLLAVLLIASTAVFSVSAVSQSYSYIYNYALKVNGHDGFAITVNKIRRRK